MSREYNIVFSVVKWVGQLMWLPAILNNIRIPDHYVVLTNLYYKVIDYCQEPVTYKIIVLYTVVLIKHV